MKEEPKRLWLEALRSGKYKKTIKTLRVPENRFCCLGVLCEVFREVTGLGEWHPFVDGYTFEVAGARASCYLPLPVMEWAGLEADDPEIGANSTLSRLNDRDFASHSDFLALAQVIEERL